MGNNSIIEHRANYHFVALREEFLLICQQCKYKKLGTAKSKNKASLHCKALILDILEHWTNTKRDKGVSFAVFMTYEQWSDAMYGMFGRNVIIDSLDELIGEGLITREPYIMYGKKTFQYYLNYQDLNNRIKQLPSKPADNLLPQKEAFTNKPDSRLQINDDAFTSNHNLDTTQIHDIDSSKIEGEEEATSTSKETFILSDDQQKFLIDIFYQSKIGKAKPQVNAALQEHLMRLMEFTKTVEELDSLYEYTQKRIIADNLKDQTVYPGNLTSTKYLGGWLQEQERKAKEHMPNLTHQRLQASTPGSQYIVDTFVEVDEEQMKDIDGGLIFGELPEYWTEEHIKHERPIRQSLIRTRLNQWRQEHDLFTEGVLAGQPSYHADPWA